MLIAVVTVSVLHCSSFSFLNVLDCIGKMSSLKPSSSWQPFATVVNLYTVQLYKPHRWWPTSAYPALSCLLCQMFSYSSVYVTHKKNAILAAKLNVLKSWLHTIETKSLTKSLVAVASPLWMVQPSLLQLMLAFPRHPASSQETVNAEWLSKRRVALSQSPWLITNMFMFLIFSPVSNTPTEKSTLVIGSTELRNVKLTTQAAIVTCIPWGRATWIQV